MVRGIVGIGFWKAYRRTRDVRNEIANNKQQVVIKEVTNTNNATTTKQVPDNQTEDTNDVAPPSPEFSIHTTNAGDNPYIRRPHPLKVHLFPQDYRLQPSDITRKIAKYNLRPNPKPNANPDFRRLDPMTTTH